MFYKMSLYQYHKEGLMMHKLKYAQIQPGNSIQEKMAQSEIIESESLDKLHDKSDWDNDQS